MATYNQTMDAAWEFFGSNSPKVLPILRDQLKAEIKSPGRSDLVLLDLGYFLYSHGVRDDKAVALDALFHLDPRAKIVVENHKELFEFAHAAAIAHDPRVLSLIDLAFLTSDEKIFIPQHALQLDGTLVCVFLYGAYGSDATTDLRARLLDQAVAKRVLEILGWLGSPEDIHAVGDALMRSPHYDTLARVTSYMMQTGGPAGREYLLNLDATTLDAQSREYLDKTRAAIQNISFKAIQASFEHVPGDKQVSDSELKGRLDQMIENDGKDDRTSPLAILDSGVGSDILIPKLLEVRTATFRRLSNEALSDVEIDNALINGLRYREH